MERLKMANNIELAGDVFIVPNSLGKGSSRLLSGSTIKELLVNNFPDLGNDDRVVETWSCSPGVSENLQDHGFYAVDETGHDWYVRPVMGANYVPVSVFTGKHEGDTVYLTISAIARRFERKDGDIECFERDITLSMTLTLAQAKYRYRSFGNFEECLQKLLDR